MKSLALLFLAFVAGTTGFLIKVPLAPISVPTLAPSGWVHVQKMILPLFENVCEESSNPMISRLSEEFISNPSAGDFSSPEAITRFQSLKSGKGFLRKGEIFSDYNSTHTDELKIVYDVMCSAKNFDTFFKVAAWARQNLNCGLYVNLIYLALEHRRDTEKLTLPAPYELLPNYFIRKDIIIQGSSLLAGEEFTPSEGVRDEGNSYTLDANYTANFYDNDDESKLAYFREDIGLNSYFFLNMMKRAPWLKENVDINSQYGEELYHMMKQLVARYNLERYSNGMSEQDGLSWDSVFDKAYDPMLVYSNGNEFIHRTTTLQLPENEDKALLQTIENNIATVVSHMRESGYNKSQILNHLMEILVTSEKSYDTLARHLLGKALSNNGQPTIFDHYMTSLRDPMVWKLYKKMVDLIDTSLSKLPSYTKNELFFPGVEVINIDVKKITTNFDYFEFDITEALKIGNGDTTFQVKIGQSRLNHKPFTMKMNISSLVSQKGLVKIYIGPKMMPGEFARKKNLFALLDFFEINLKKGSNIITRSSSDMKQLSSDFISFNDLKKKVEDAQFGLDSLPLNIIDSQINFPERLVIPKGTPEGLPLQLFVFVAPFVKTTFSTAYTMPSTEFNSAVLSPLYPLDLAMEDRILLDLPNAMLKDIMVTHKGAGKPSAYGGSQSEKSWNDKPSYGTPPRPNAYMNENQIDHSSFNGVYQNNVDRFQNDATFEGPRPTLQAPPSNQYSYKQKDFFDYKSKKVDYKTINKNKPTEKPDYVEIVNDNETPDKSNLLVDQSTNKNNEVEFPSIVSNKVDTDGIYSINDEYLHDNKVVPTKLKHNLLKSSFDKKSKLTKYEKFLDENKTENYAPKRVDNKVLINKNVEKNIVRPAKFYENKMKENIVIVPDKTSKQPSDTVYVDMRNEDDVDVYRIYRKNNDLVSSNESNNKYDDINVKEAQNFHDYIGIYKDDSKEEFVKVVPMTITNVPKNSINTMYKYIMRLINNQTIKEDEVATVEELD